MPPAWNEDELRRLRYGPDAGEEPGGIGPIWIRATTAGSADEVLRRTTEALEAVLKLDPQSWPAPEVWTLLLPAWLAAQCTGEGREDEEDRATAAEWAQGFAPGAREWLWWDGRIRDRRTLRIAVEVERCPFSWASLDWLLRAAGAIEVREETGQLLPDRPAWWRRVLPGRAR